MFMFQGPMSEAQLIRADWNRMAPVTEAWRTDPLHYSRGFDSFLEEGLNRRDAYGSCRNNGSRDNAGSRVDLVSQRDPLRAVFSGVVIARSPPSLRHGLAVRHVTRDRHCSVLLLLSYRRHGKFNIMPTMQSYVLTGSTQHSFSAVAHFVFKDESLN